MKALAKILLILIILADLALLSVWGVFAYTVSQPYKPNSDINKKVEIAQGAGVEDIAGILVQEEIIDKEFTFIMFALLERKSTSLQAGIYSLSPAMNIKELVVILSEGETREFKNVTIPEGFNNQQVADHLAQEGVIADKEAFLNAAAISTSSAYVKYEYDFLNRINADTLEGFLFPDTYEFKAQSDPDAVIDKMLKNFSNKGSDIFEQAPTGQADGYSPYQLLTMASILEKEVQTELDMRMAAGVLYNRLEINMPLQVDAALVYITGKKTGQLTNADKQIAHAYNTYQNRGLTPGPISNPGQKAISAAMNPVANDYFYYLSAPDGTTHFARTLEEHNSNKQRYLR